MKKVLIISYFFPPRHSVASIRLEGLAKYLPQFGWEPVILTPRLTGRTQNQFNVIETDYPGDITYLIRKKLGLDVNKRLEEGLGIPLSIRETKNRWIINILGFFYGILTFPEEQKTWQAYGYKSGENYLKKNNVDCILSSASPATSHTIATKLATQFKIPWVADFRDLWSQNHYYLYGPVFRFIDRLIEIKTLTPCQTTTTVSEPLAKLLRQLHKNIPSFSIPNGFNPEILNLSPLPLSTKFTINYTGHIYPNKRDPSLLFQAVRSLIAKSEIDPQSIQINFYGRKQFFLDQEIKKYGLQQITFQNGEINFQESLRKQRESQLLLLLSWTDPREKGVYTGKVFEYLAAKRPILALGGPADGVIPQLMRTTKAGVHVNDFQTLEKILLDYYREFQETGRVMYHGIDEEINKYSHIEMARKFAEVLNGVVEKKPPS